MSAYEIVSTVLTTLGLVVSTIVLIFLLQQVRLLARQVQDSRLAMELATAQAEAENIRRKQRATVDFLAGTLSKIQDLYDMLPDAGSSKLAKFTERAMTADSAEFIAVRNYLNFLEDLCAGVNLDVFDKQVVFRSVGGRLSRAWHNYKSWIYAEREKLDRILFTELEATVSEYQEWYHGAHL